MMTDDLINDANAKATPSQEHGQDPRKPETGCSENQRAGAGVKWVPPLLVAVVLIQ